MNDEEPCSLLVQIAVSGMQSIKFGIGIAFVNRVLSLFKVTFQEDAPEIVVGKEPSNGVKYRFQMIKFRAVFLFAFAFQIKVGKIFFQQFPFHAFQRCISGKYSDRNFDRKFTAESSIITVFSAIRFNLYRQHSLTSFRISGCSIFVKLMLDTALAGEALSFKGIFARSQMSSSLEKPVLTGGRK